MQFLDRSSPIRFVVSAVLVSTCFLASVTANAVDRYPTNVTQLKQVFTDADADPGNTYNAYLSSSGWFDVSSVASVDGLKLTKGHVNIYGDSTMKAVWRYAITGNDATAVFTLEAASGFRPSLGLWGLQVMHGYRQGGNGGIRAVGADLDLYYTFVHDNKSDFPGSGIYIGENTHFYMWRSEVDSNTSTSVQGPSPSCGGGVLGAGGGLGIAGTAATTAYIIDSTFKDNHACRGGAIASIGGTNGGPQVYLYNTTIINNTADMQGGGIFADMDGRFDIYFSSIVRNTAAKVYDSGPEERGGGGVSFRGYRGGWFMGASIIAENILGDFPSRIPVAGVKYNNTDCQAGTAIRTTRPDVGVIGNIIGKIDRCTFLGSTSWWGIGTDKKPFVAGLEATTDVSTPWVDSFTVVRPSANGPALRSYNPNSSRGNGRVALNCRSEDELGDTTYEVPCTPGSIELPTP